MNDAELHGLISQGECMTVEFKSERKQISDNEIYEQVVCFANAEGGVILLGVEDDGTITGARPRHGKTITAQKLQAAIFNNTNPPISVKVSVLKLQEGLVVALEVGKCTDEICSTSKGLVLRRVLGTQGPSCQPFYPSSQRSRRTDLGLLDFSARAVDSSTWSDLDPLELERVHQTIRRLRGEVNLTKLKEREFAKALGLVETVNDKLVPTVTGLLILGREEALRRFLPTHEIAFQVIDTRGNVLVNDFYHGPLLKVIERIEERFGSRNQEQEAQVGLFRLAIPDYSPESFREAVNNAILHRDYSRQGTVFIQWHSDYMLIANPGGFPEGITLDNILVHEPKPRNPRLAEAFLRVGLVEKTGRGIDKIFLGQLRFGRPAPDYSQSNSDGVRVVLAGGKASLNFAAFLVEQDSKGAPLSLEDILILNQLQQQRRVDTSTIARLIQASQARARSILERLLERGLIEAGGERRGRVYQLSASLYKSIASTAAYIRARGMDRIQQEEAILRFVKVDKAITRGQVIELCGTTPDQASYILKNLVKRGRLVAQGKGRRWIRYELPKEA